MTRPSFAQPAALCTLVALLLTGPGAADAIDPRTALDALRFPNDTRARVEAGKFVEVALPTHSDRDLNVGIAFFVAKQSPAALARTVREEKRVLRADPNLIAFGDFDGEGTAADLVGLRLTPAQRKSFAHAAPGGTSTCPGTRSPPSTPPAATRTRSRTRSVRSCSRAIAPIP